MSRPSPAISATGTLRPAARHVITLEGEIETGLSNGTTRRFGAGHVALT